MKQAIKKKSKLSLKEALAAIKKEQGMGENIDLEHSNADKDMEWLAMPKGFVDATKLPGIPISYVTTLCGHSNTGKSTIVNHAIVAAQRQGLLPILIDTESNFSPRYCQDMGAEFEIEYGEFVDEETGEVIKKPINYGGTFVYYDNNLLAKNFGDYDYSAGKVTKTFRKQACIEDVAACINYWLDKLDNGELPCGVVFIWDSVGSLPSFKSINGRVRNNMFDAGSMSQCFSDIVNGRIPQTRKVSCDYTATLILVNKVWLDSMTAPMSAPSLELKGGKTIWYGTRLLLLMGGQLKSSTKRLNATSKGETYQYGIETKIKVLKNQLPLPWNITYEGKVICTPYGMIAEDEVDAFKKEKIPSILKELSKSAEEILANEITYSEAEEDNV